MMEIKPPKDIDVERDEKVLKMLNEAIRILGGPKKLIIFRNLTWITSLLRAGYALLLKDAGYTYEDIAKKLGITKATVQRMMSADPNAVMKKLEGELTGDEIDDHVAGGLAKLAYKAMKTRVLEEEIKSVSDTAEVLGVEWAVKVLQMIKGLDFPVDRENIRERLKGIYIFNISIDDIIKELKYPIDSPAILIKEISRVLRSKGVHPSRG